MGTAQLLLLGWVTVLQKCMPQGGNRKFWTPQWDNGLLWDWFEMGVQHYPSTAKCLTDCDRSSPDGNFRQWWGFSPGNKLYAQMCWLVTWLECPGDAQAASAVELICVHRQTLVNSWNCYCSYRNAHITHFWCVVKIVRSCFICC